MTAQEADPIPLLIGNQSDEGQAPFASTTMTAQVYAAELQNLADAICLKRQKLDKVVFFTSPNLRSWAARLISSLGNFFILLTWLLLAPTFSPLEIVCPVHAFQWSAGIRQLRLYPLLGGGGEQYVATQYHKRRSSRPNRNSQIKLNQTMKKHRYKSYRNLVVKVQFKSI